MVADGGRGMPSGRNTQYQQKSSLDTKEELLRILTKINEIRFIRLNLQRFTMYSALSHRYVNFIFSQGTHKLSGTATGHKK